MTGPVGVFSIAPGASFVDSLAAGVLAEADGDPLHLADTTILLPTRRACRALREAFLRQSDGQALLLPRMRPIGDVEPDEAAIGETPGYEELTLPPAISESRRLLLMAQLILAWDRATDGEELGRITDDHAVRLAQELARLIDQVQIERLDFERLDALAPREYAHHWERTVEFLKIATAQWPALLAAEGALDPAERRNRLIDSVVRRWTASPPTGPVLAAGSTGSVPATADLLAIVAGLPRGAVVLPGLDRDMDARAWDAAAEDQTHPQFGLHRLLDRLGLSRDDVRDWPSPVAPTPQSVARAALASEALRPAETTDAWRDLREIPAAALEGVERIDCPGEKEEAEVIALMLRRALETPGRTAALVTPDRRLARRVVVALRRWNIEIDDSAGQPLADTAPGVFLRLVARMVAEGFAPVALLAVCKHPFALGGAAPGLLRRRARLLERWVLRAPRPAPGIAELRAALQALKGHAAPAPAEKTELEALLDDLEGGFAAFGDLLGQDRVSLSGLVDAHVAAAEQFARSDTEEGAARLWSGEAGETLAEFVLELRDAADSLPDIPPANYPDMLDALMEGRTVRPRHSRHPRLNIWGPLEARLQHADLIVLGGLNEGVWPGELRPDPWMNRPMRDLFGLPLPERRIGLSAHDFVQLLCAPQVALTRSQKMEGTPTVPSRWLLRLSAVLDGAEFDNPLAPDTNWRALQRGLLSVDGHRPVQAPMPTPPVAARPRRLSVTQIETWRRDPYGIYARYILGLRPLDPLEADPGAADRGTIIHAALDRYLREQEEAPGGDAYERLLAVGREAFGSYLAWPSVYAFWWPRFTRIARWFVDREAENRAGIAATTTEVRGTLTLDGPAGPFELTAVADRIDRETGGELVIIDYKTGSPPTDKDIREGWAPQLPLEAAIAAEGGFAGVPAAAVARLEHWRLSGGAPPAQKFPVKDDPANLAAAALDGLRSLLVAFDDADTPYHAVPNSRHAPRFNDYAHLARIREWLEHDGDQDGGGGA
jgi:ATP-dependent helicase/nuclease subunit B